MVDSGVLRKTHLFERLNQQVVSARLPLASSIGQLLIGPDSGGGGSLKSAVRQSISSFWLARSEGACEALPRANMALA